MAKFVIDDSARPEIKLVGLEMTPVVVVDDVCGNFVQLQKAARSRVYSPVKNSFYPGIRASFADIDLSSLEARLSPLLRQIHHIPNELTPQWKHNCFSLITVPEERLHPLQCLPHFDAPNPYHFAALLYLADTIHGGTGLFRHIDSGFETISEQRCEPYFASATSYIETENFKPGYIKASNRHFELIYEVPYKANRLVVYPGNILHSTLVQPDTDIDANPKTGRLTANLFLEFC